MRALEKKLLAGEIDLAVHSLKDLTTEIPEGLTLAAVPEREDPRDALVTLEGAELGDLPPEARVGTSSLRRRAQLLHHRPDLQIEPLRGNVDTRVERVRDRKVDAVVLALAGIRRLAISAVEVWARL